MNKKKLNYIGCDKKYFRNKNNKYSIEELNRIEKETNSSKDILIYLINLVNSMKENNIIKNSFASIGKRVFLY